MEDEHQYPKPDAIPLGIDNVRRSASEIQALEAHKQWQDADSAAPVEEERYGSFTATQLEERRLTLGASEIAAVAGVHPYSNALDIYLSKVGQRPDRDAALEGYAQWGLRLEPLIAKAYADIHDVSLILGERTVSKEADWMSATPDRLVLRNWGSTFSEKDAIDRGLELKNRNAHVAHLFGESGSDVVPFDIAAQCHWSMMVTGLDVWDVAVLLGGNDLRWYRLHRDDEIRDGLFEAGFNFWHQHVLKKVPPPVDGSESYSRYLKQKFLSHTEQLREATPEEAEAIADLRIARANLKAAEDEAKLRENIVKAAIADAGGIVAPTGKVTWRKTKDTTGVDYRTLAFELAVKAGLSLDEQRALEEQHTVVTKQGSRRFLTTFPKEG